ncbi:hypothetical protein BJ741DRAFT_597490 [Chytriomyces cf. hyalinus JEL632]|nr:hypothetical protein BJ741DRAFT_597490 [Chytriomyces cf. hyalinus JEL632]
MSDAYFTAGGGLKLKGVAGGSGITKKKKKKDKKEKESVEVQREEAANTQSSSASVADDKPSQTGRNLTDAEKRFEETRRKRQEEKAAKLAQKSHKERVAEFNQYLESLSEHHDIPRVGPG